MLGENVCRIYAKTCRNHAAPVSESAGMVR